MASDLQAVFDYIDAHQEDFIERLRALCQQPSVAAQSPGMQETAEKTYERLRNHLRDQGFDDIEVELLGPEMPSMSPMDSDIVRVVVETAKELYGHEPVIDPINPGSGPSWLLCDRFNVPMAGAGVGYSESRAHAPNENIRLADYIQGIKHIALILDRFGSLA